MSTPTLKHAKRRNGHRTLATAAKVTDTRIALYCRVSTEEQADKNTIQAQLTYLRGRAALDGIPIVGEYIDEGVSGTTPLAERPGASRLLADATDGYFGAVVVYKVDRMARSLRVLLDGHTALEACGVALKSATEPFDSSTPIGKFLFQLLGSMAELDRSTLLERMSLGRDRVTQEGKWVTGPIPLGYMLDAACCLIPSTRLVEQLGMTEAELIRDLFRRIAEGSSSIREAQRLQDLGVSLTRYYTNGTVHTSTSGQWHVSRILKMIKSETYIGVHRFKSRFGTIERQVPALVSRDLWEQANNRLRQNQTLPKRNATRVYLLRSLVTCGLCGKSFVGQRISSMKSRNDNWYYRCGGRGATGTPLPQDRCKGKALPAIELEEHIWQRCRHFILNPQDTIAEIERQLAQQTPQGEDTTNREQALALQLAEKQQEEERLLTVFRRGRITLQAFEAEMDRVDTERDTLQRELATLRSQQKRHGERLSYFERSEALLARWREELARIEAADDREAKRQLIADFVSAITVHSDGVHVRYRFDAANDCNAMPLSFVADHTTVSTTAISGRACR